MASESRYYLLRVTTNYARLFLTFAIGIVFVRLIFRTLGDDGFGLIGLLGSANGITLMVQIVVQRSMIRELGTAYHSDDPETFIGTYNSALVLTWLAAGVSSGLFACLWWLLPWMAIPEHMLMPARWFVVSSAVQAAVVIVLAAPMNMYLVKERMVWFNLWRVLERVCTLAGALVITYAYGGADPGYCVIVYGWVVAALITVTHLTAVVLIILGDRRLVPRPHRANRTDMRAVVSVGGWNTGVVAALNLHNHTDNIIMNLAFGLFGNAVFSLSLRLTGYVRMFATGMTTGLDAASVRMSSGDESGDRLARLIYHTTRLHGLATLPAVMCMCLLAEPALMLWVGRAVDSPETVIPAAVLVTWTLAVGITVHSIADGWIMVLYGAGYISRYGPLVIIGGVANPVLAGLLLWLLPGEPQAMRLVAPALGYSVILVVLHFIALPMVMTRTIDVRLRDVYLPLVAPLTAALLAAVIPAAALYLIERWTLVWLAAVLIGYGVTFAPLSYMLVLTADERRRVVGLIKRVAGRRTRAEG